MQSLILDPINLAIVCEYGFWNRKSSGSKQLRRIFKKCISVDADLGRDYWGAFYDGTNARPLGEEEMKYRDMISSSSMTLAESDSILDGLEMEVPFTDRLEFYPVSRCSLSEIPSGSKPKKLLGPTSRSARFSGLLVHPIGWSG